MPQETNTQMPANERSPKTSIKVIKQRVAGEKVSSPEEDFVAIEDPLEIRLIFESKGKQVEKTLVVTMRTPGHDKELIYGFLYCEGFIQSANEIRKITFDGAKTTAAPTFASVHLAQGIDVSEQSCERNFAVHSSCGVCGTTRIGHLNIPKALKVFDSSKVALENIHTFPEKMHVQQDTFQQTGGLHACALFTSDGQLQILREDIGRHNALDKMIGAGLIQGILPRKGQTLCVSGRMSYEILQKALIARIPLIAGVGAPSSLAVALADDFNITLVGFLRNNSFNIYSHPERILKA